MNLVNFINDTLNNGGASFNLLTSEYNPNSGYMVAVKGYEVKIPVEQFNRKTVADYIANNVYMLLTNVDSNLFLGAWVDEGFVYLDISMKIEDKIQALHLAIDSKELAIFDNENKESVFVEGFLKVDFDTINKESAIKMYYDWCNNFLRIETFAEYYRLHVWQAEKIINLGRKLNNNN